MSKLNGKVALITGAGAGIGAGIARTYAKYGAKLCLVDASPVVEETAKAIHENYGVDAIAVVADVSKPDQMLNAAAEAKEKYGRIDVACCNAGVCRLSPFEDHSEEDLDLTINVNIKGAWNTCKAVIPYMLEQGGGAIVIASSVTGDIVVDPGEASYAMSKAALVGLTKALAVEYAARNIRVNCTQLGYAKTPMTEKMARESCPEDPESVFTEMAKAIPMRRLANPNEVGELTAFLGSDEASYLTGSQVVIDGGSTLPETVSMGV